MPLSVNVNQLVFFIFFHTNNESVLLCAGSFCTSFVKDVTKYNFNFAQLKK